MWRQRRERRAGRRILTALGVFVLLCLALLLALPYLVNIEKYRAVIAEEMGRQLGRPVQISTLRLRAIPRLSLEIQGLQISDPPRLGGKAALTAKGLRANVRILPLLQRRLDIQSIDLDQPVVVVRRDKAGFNNWFGPARGKPTSPKAQPPSPTRKQPEPPATEEAGAPSQLLAGLLIGNLRVKDAVIRLEDAHLRSPVTLKGIQVALKQPSPESPVKVRLWAKNPAFQLSADVGPLNLENPLATHADAKLVIGNGWVKAGQPCLQRRQTDSSLQLTGGNLSGEMEFRGNLVNKADIKGDFTLSSLQGRIGTRSIKENPNLDLQVKANLGLSRSNAEAPLALKTDGQVSLGRLLFQITGKGSMDPENLRFETSIHGARLQGSDLIPILQAVLGETAKDLQVSGLIGFNLKARKERQTTFANLTLDGRQAALEFGKTFRKASGVPMKLAGEMSMNSQRVEVKPFSLSLRQIRFGGRVRQSGDLVNFSGQTNNFNLEGLDTLFPAAVPYAVAGKAQISLTGNGKLEDIRRQGLQLRVNLEQAAMSLPGHPNRIRNLYGVVRVTPQTLQLNKTRAQVGKSRVELEAGLTDFQAPRIRFDLKSPAFRLEDFLPPPPAKKKTAALPRPSLIRKVSWAPRRRYFAATTKAEQVTKRKSPLPVILEKTQAEGTIQIGRGEAKGFRFSKLSGDLRLKQGTVLGRRLKAELYGGTFQGEGEYSLKQDPAPFQGRVVLKGVRAEQALKDQIPGPSPLTGRLDLDGDFKGLGMDAEALKQTLFGKGNFSLADGEIRQLEILGDLEKLLKAPGIFGLKDGRKQFKQFHGPFEIQKGKVLLPNLRMASSGVSLQAKGEAGLNMRGRFDVLASFDENASRRLSRGFLKSFIQPGQPFEVPFKLSGPLAAPKVSLDPGFLQRTIRRNPGKFIQDTLKNLLR
jgi:uncharacterized protein involved in outer membrane biogenesis